MATTTVILGVGVAAMVASVVTSIYSATKSTHEPSLAASGTTEAAIDTTAQQAAYAEAETLRKRRGASASMLTGPQGIMTTPTTLKQRLGD